MKWWQEEIGVRDIWIGMMADNKNSLRVAEKLGFEKKCPLPVLLPNGKEDTALACVLPSTEWPAGIKLNMAADD